MNKDVQRDQSVQKLPEKSEKTENSENPIDKVAMAPIDPALLAAINAAVTHAVSGIVKQLAPQTAPQVNPVPSPTVNTLKNPMPVPQQAAYKSKLQGIPVEPGEDLRHVHPNVIHAWFRNLEDRWKAQYNNKKVGNEPVNVSWTRG